MIDLKIAPPEDQYVSEVKDEFGNQQMFLGGYLSGDGFFLNVNIGDYLHSTLSDEEIDEAISKFREFLTNAFKEKNRVKED